MLLAQLAVLQTRLFGVEKVSKAPLTVAVVGAGLIAREEHLPAWTLFPQAQVLWLVEPQEPVRHRVQREFDIPRVAATVEPVLDDPRVKVVDICAPSGLHAPLAQQALEAGKHVLCEKPMALTAQQAWNLVGLARRKGLRLMIGHHLRFDPVARALRKALQEWGAGEFHAIRAQWIRQRRLPARPSFTQRSLAGGGVLLDLGVHMIDLAWWMAGSPRPLAASAAINNRLARRPDVKGQWGHWNPNTIEVEDFAWGQIRFENQLLLSLEVSWLALDPREEYQQVQWYGNRWGVLWPRGQLVAHRRGRPWAVQVPPAHSHKPHRLLIWEFAQALLHDIPEPIPPEQIATVTAMIEALYRSAQLGQEVPVPQPPEENLA